MHLYLNFWPASHRRAEESRLSMPTLTPVQNGVSGYKITQRFTMWCSSHGIVAR